jgi:hypothetical protein
MLEFAVFKTWNEKKKVGLGRILTPKGVFFSCGLLKTPA